ncbi:cobalt-precorrin-4/precorrin-4 C(11)-methyltransferase [Nocardioides daphniae]|uniref:Precorrin-4 C(11)-methyltransferase n=1 Tax=Nocardioides daphniae TaxID=402297 RepID=A0ABQ1QFS9_9ACTN|nr:SAM-dependent methyltransferase [Nocardioides daphniae]GGD24807.1 precorrin-4 C(11)-methyltransferase [Nocardioides daphniae]
MTVHFVGAGPGSADLLTVRATRLLASADVVLYPGTYLDPEVLSHCGPRATLVDTQDLDLDQITAHLVDGSRAGLDVVRLTSGDPSLYSALHEQTKRLDAADVTWSVTPGVPAYAAAAARVGSELTVPLVAQSVVLTRTQARSTAMGAGESLTDFAATGATVVLHLAITRTRALMAELEPVVGGDCPVVVVHRASQPEELVLRGTVDSIAEAVEEAGLRQAAVVLVGRALAASGTRAGGESYLYSPHRDRLGKRLEE